MRYLIRLFVFSITVFLSYPSFATVIVDTGVTPCVQYQPCGGIGINNRSGIQSSAAAEFTLTETTVLTDLFLWMGTFFQVGNDFTMAIYADGGDIPQATNELYSSAVVITDTGDEDDYNNQWQGLTGLSWLLDPGEYWLAAEVRDGQTYRGYLPGSRLVSVPNPVPNYAFLHTPNGSWLSDESLDFSVRIEGDLVAVPEPASIYLLMVMLFFVAISSKRNIWFRKDIRL